MKTIKVMQDDLKDCGVCCLLSIIRYYNSDVTKEYLRELTKTSNDGVSAYNIIQASKELGFNALGVTGEINNIKHENLPIIAHVIINKSFSHFIVIYKINNNYATIMDPSIGIKKIKIKELEQILTKNYIILKPVKPIPKLTNNIKIKKIIKKLISNYKLELIILLTISIINTIFTILSTYNLKLIINDNNIDTINKITYIIILINLIKIISNYIKNKIINYINYHLSNNLFITIYNHIINLPYLYYKNRTTGDVITRINDIINIKELISKIFVTIIIDSITITLVFTFLFKINYTLSIIVLINTIIYLIIILSYNPKLNKNIKKIYIKNAEVNNYLVETISSINTIKGLMKENYYINEMSYKYKSLTNTNYKLINILTNEELYQNIIVFITTTIILYIGIKNVNQNIIALSSLITFISLLNYTIEPISNISNTILEIINTKESINRIKELIIIPKEEIKYIKEKSITLEKNNIEIQNLSYGYNDQNILKNININIENNQKVLIYGQSGHGKSTLMKILSGYIKDYKGIIKINNIDLNIFTQYELRKKICYISQEEKIYTDSIYNNIIIDNNIEYNDFLKICQNLKIDEIVKNNILGYDMLLESEGTNISRGEKSRIIIARNLINKKDSNIFIIDEQLSSLDIKLERMILKYLFQILKDKTVIIISHRFNNNDLFDKIINLGEK